MSKSFKDWKLPAKMIKINEIEDDSRVMLFGVVLYKEQETNSILLDDGSGSVLVRFDFSPEVNVKDFVRVFGTPLIGEKVEIRGEAIQLMENLDFDLYKRAVEIFKKAMGGN